MLGPCSPSHVPRSRPQLAKKRGRYFLLSNMCSKSPVVGACLCGFSHSPMQGGHFIFFSDSSDVHVSYWSPWVEVGKQSVFQVPRHNSEVLWRESFHVTLHNPWTTAGYMRIQLNSDTIYSEEPESAGWGLIPTR